MAQMGMLDRKSVDNFMKRANLNKEHLEAIEGMYSVVLDDKELKKLADYLLDELLRLEKYDDLVSKIAKLGGER